MKTLADLDQDFKNWIDELLLLRKKIEEDPDYSSPYFPDDFIKIIASRLNKTEKLYDFAEDRALKQKRDSIEKQAKMLEEIQRLQQEIEKHERRITFLFEEIKKVKHERR